WYPPSRERFAGPASESALAALSSPPALRPGRWGPILGGSGWCARPGRFHGAARQVRQPSAIERSASHGRRFVATVGGDPAPFGPSSPPWVRLRAEPRHTPCTRYRLTLLERNHGWPRIRCV